MDQSNTCGAHPRRVTESAVAAFSSWWAILSVIASSLAGFSLVHRILQMELVDVLAEIVRLYQSIYTPFIWFADIFNWPRPASWLIDAFAIWVLVGGIVLRSAWVLRASSVEDQRRKWRIEKAAARQRRSHLGPRIDQTVSRINKERLINRSNTLAKSPIWSYLIGVPSAAPWFVLCGIFLWPAYVYWLVEEPFVHVTRDESYVYVVQEPAIFPHEDAVAFGYEFKYDLRVILSIQALAAIACVAVWFALQATLELYS